MIQVSLLSSCLIAFIEIMLSKLFASGIFTHIMKAFCKRGLRESFCAFDSLISSSRYLIDPFINCAISLYKVLLLRGCFESSIFALNSVTCVSYVPFFNIRWVWHVMLISPSALTRSSFLESMALLVSAVVKHSSSPTHCRKYEFSFSTAPISGWCSYDTMRRAGAAR